MEVCLPPYLRHFFYWVRYIYRPLYPISYVHTLPPTFHTRQCSPSFLYIYMKSLSFLPNGGFQLIDIASSQVFILAFYTHHSSYPSYIKIILSPILVIISSLNMFFTLSYIHFSRHTFPPIYILYYFYFYAFLAILNSIPITQPPTFVRLCSWSVFGIHRALNHHNSIFQR